MKAGKFVELIDMLNHITDICNEIRDNEETSSISVLTVSRDSHGGMTIHMSPTSALMEIAKSLGIETQTVPFGDGKFPETPIQTEFTLRDVTFFSLNRIQ